MRKKVIVLFLVLIFVFTLFIKLSKTEDKLDIPPGMEVINVGGVRYIAPKGSKVKESGGVVTIEGHNEYLARKLSGIEERLSAIEEDIKELKKTRNITAPDAGDSSREGVQVAPASGEKEEQQQEN